MGILYVNSYSFNGHMLCPFILIAVGISQPLWAFHIRSNKTKTSLQRHKMISFAADFT
jgi:hypothetical protein